MSESHAGLALVEPIRARVALWRRRHRQHADRAQTYRVTYDGSTVAELSAVRSIATLDEELASAAWELAQGVGRAVTVDVLALDAHEVELARMPLRVVPAAPPAAAAAGDLQSVVRVLLESHQQQARLIVDMAAAFTAQLREASTITAELARSAASRARNAELEAAGAADTVRDALAVARDAHDREPRRNVGDRALDVFESLVRVKLGELAAPSAPSAPVEAAAPVEAVEAAAPVEAAEAAA